MTDPQEYRERMQKLQAAGFADVEIRPKDGTFGTIPEGMPFSALISARKL